MGPPPERPKGGVWESTENQGRRKRGHPRWDIFLVLLEAGEGKKLSFQVYLKQFGLTQNETLGYLI